MSRCHAAPGDVPEAWRPKHHLHYESRVLDVLDDLLKYSGRSRGPVWAEKCFKIL